MNDESRMQVNDGETPLSMPDHSIVAPITKPANGYGKAAAAVAVAGLALALPLTKVQDVEAVVEHCPADSYEGQEIGDPGDCADCFWSAVPADCWTINNNPGDSFNDGGGGGGPSYDQCQINNDPICYGIYGE